MASSSSSMDRFAAIESAARALYPGWYPVAINHRGNSIQHGRGRERPSPAIHHARWARLSSIPPPPPSLPPSLLSFPLAVCRPALLARAGPVAWMARRYSRADYSRIMSTGRDAPMKSSRRPRSDEHSYANSQCFLIPVRVISGTVGWQGEWYRGNLM